MLVEQMADDSGHQTRIARTQIEPFLVIVCLRLAGRLGGPGQTTARLLDFIDRQGTAPEAGIDHHLDALNPPLPGSPEGLPQVVSAQFKSIDISRNPRFNMIFEPRVCMPFCRKMAAPRRSAVRVWSVLRSR